MPIYDFECSRHHLFEALARVDDDKLPCREPGCAETAERIFISVSGVGDRHAQGFHPIAYAEGPKGQIFFLGHEHGRIPKGYERKQIKTIAEARAFERRVNNVELGKYRELKEREEHTFGAWRSQQRKELLAKLHTMSPASRDLAMYAIRAHNEKRRESFYPNFHIEILSQDSTNREGYVDERTGWKRRRA